jgi:hypothetical protein
MATFINVTSGGDELLIRAKEQQQAARWAHGERNQRQGLSNDKAKQDPLDPQGKGLEPLPVRRDISASGSGDAFMAVIVQASVGIQGQRASDDLWISLNGQQLAFLDFSPAVYWAGAKLISGQYYFGYAFLGSGSGTSRLLGSRFFQTAPAAIQSYFGALSPQAFRLPSSQVKKKPLFNTITIASATGARDSAGEIYAGFLSKAEYGQRTWNVPQGSTRTFSVAWWGQIPA